MKRIVYYLVFIGRFILGMIVGMRIYHYCQMGFAGHVLSFLIEGAVLAILNFIAYYYVHESKLETAIRWNKRDRYIIDWGRKELVCNNRRGYKKRQWIQPIILVTGIIVLIILSIAKHSHPSVPSVTVALPSTVILGILWFLQMKYNHWCLKKDREYDYYGKLK